MSDIHMEIVTLCSIELAGAPASPLGGAAALCRRPTTLALSVAVGFAAGALLGAFAFEMLPQSARLASLPVAVTGFAAGFAVLYGLDLFVHRGASASRRCSNSWRRA
jgi:ZIP family zinc transporter